IKDNHVINSYNNFRLLTQSFSPFKKNITNCYQPIEKYSDNELNNILSLKDSKTIFVKYRIPNNEKIFQIYKNLNSSFPIIKKC
ncbi:hypothetical protein, partial [Acinetobacter stercoris]|uniref:hypothetical protein n=1 Tax=Acinetobacter stercoris TaxID=2126983 RepID=UPI001BC87B34